MKLRTLRDIQSAETDELLSEVSLQHFIVDHEYSKMICSELVARAEKGKLDDVLGKIQNKFVKIEESVYPDKRLNNGLMRLIYETLYKLEKHLNASASVNAGDKIQNTKAKVTGEIGSNLEKQSIPELKDFFKTNMEQFNFTEEGTYRKGTGDNILNFLYEYDQQLQTPRFSSKQDACDVYSALTKYSDEELTIKKLDDNRNYRNIPVIAFTNQSFGYILAVSQDNGESVWRG